MADQRTREENRHIFIIYIYILWLGLFVIFVKKRTHRENWKKSLARGRDYENTIGSILATAYDAV